MIDMNETKLTTLDQLRAFVQGTQEVQFVPAAGHGKNERYAFIQGVVRRFGYAGLPRADKAVVLRSLERTTGYSRQQLTRLVKHARSAKGLRTHYGRPRQGFTRRYTQAYVLLLAQTDAAHGTLSGPATKHLLRRAWEHYGDARYERLARISVAHLYNLRAEKSYLNRRQSWSKTRSHQVPIGVRKAPAPEGTAGFLRIDSVHQGDQDGLKWVYHINAVDCGTQWEIVLTCEKISEAYLMPALEHILDQVPFNVLGVHADNGSEYLNPYVNLHRPCLFPQAITDPKGKIIKRYPQHLVATPLEKLASLAPAQQNLKPGVRLESLQHQATQLSDFEAAKQLNQARTKLFASIHRRLKKDA